MASEKLKARLVQLHNDNDRRRVRWAITGVLVVVVALVTAIAMRQPIFAQKKVAHCGKTEHVHTKDCLSQVGGCTVEEHVHTLSCYSDADADVETKEMWEATLPSPADGEALLSRVVAIARSQLGYRESSKNYLVRDGKPYGRNRYAAWAGSPYAEWNAAFACFCLDYAGVEEEVFPHATDVVGWEASLRSAGMLVEVGDSSFAPKPGDLAFVRVGDELVVGLVSSVDADTGEVRLVAGDVDDAVRELKAFPEEGDSARARSKSDQAAAVASHEVQKSAASLQDGDDLGRGSSLLVDDVAADVKKLGSKAGEMTSAAGAKSYANAGAVDAAGSSYGNGSPNVANSSSLLRNQSVPAAQRQDPVIVAYGKMPDNLRKEYDAHMERLAREEAERKATGDASELERDAGANATGADKPVDGASVDTSKTEVNQSASRADGREALELVEPSSSVEVEKPQPAEQVSGEAASGSKLSLTERAGGYEIGVEFDGEAKADYKLRVRSLRPTEAQLRQVEEGLSESLANGIRKRAHVDAHDVALIDIALVDKDGNVVEPNDSVRVSMTKISLSSNFIGTAQAVEPALVPETEAPEVVHFKGEEPNALTEALDAEGSADDFAFTTTSLSPFAFVYTVDFEYEGFTWSMAGESSTWLSQLLSELKVADFGIDDVMDVTFSNPELVEVTRQDKDGHRDWQIRSLKPFKTQETLTLALTDGVAVIDVTDNGDQDITQFLKRVEFYDDKTLVGDSLSPDTMVARPGHEYTMRLQFSEDENKDNSWQFTDDGTMTFTIPARVHLSPKAFIPDGELKFKIVLDRKHTLSDNVVTLSHNDAGQDVINIHWNTEDKELYKLLKASPRTTFALSFPFTTIDGEGDNPIHFSSSVAMDVKGDPTFDVELEKTSQVDEHDREQINYTVTATADGNVSNIVCTDTMGAALTYIESPGVSVRYVDSEGHPVTEYLATNMGTVVAAQDGKGFTFPLYKLNSGHKAIITYSAKLDYTKLGGKDNIQTTSRNTITAKDDKNNLLDEAHSELDKNIDYLQVGKSRNGKIVYEFNVEDPDVPTDPEQESQYIADHWTYMYVPWRVIYNPDAEIGVEGATLTDKIWAGKKYATTYATDKDFKVTAYPHNKDNKYEKKDGSSGDVFTPAEGVQGISVISPTEGNGYGWNDPKAAVTVTDHGAQGSSTLSNWEWTIPDKSVSGLSDDTDYTYVIEYYTKVNRAELDTTNGGGYIGNQVEESIANITRDRSVNLPGIGPDHDISVDKEHIVDEYKKINDGKTTEVYSQWTITFDRLSYGLERALVEDTLPHTKIEGVVRADTFVNVEDDGKTDIKTRNHGWKVTGLQNGETCVPNVSLDGYDVVFRFYTAYYGKDDSQNVDGLNANGNGTDDDKITISFWTLNDENWIAAAQEGKPGATTEHWNHVHLVLNGKEAVDDEYGVPKPDTSLEKSVVQAGTWTDPTLGITLPVYRYTLTLNGVTDDRFIEEGGKTILKLEDEFDNMMDYLPLNQLPEANGNSTIDGKKVLLTSRSDSDGFLVRTFPTSKVKWKATFGEITESGDKKNITITVDKSPDMLYGITDEYGNPLLHTAGEQAGQQIMTYGKSYEVSYYLAPNHAKVRQKAQEMVNKENKTPEDYQDTTLTFGNKATWENHLGNAGESVFEAEVNQDLKPVNKQQLSYNPDTETATYRIAVNPFKLTMNGGKRYSVTDEYKNLAVDFQTVQITADPQENEKDIEWSYHGNRGTFWVPDETKVTITYEAWPVGVRNNDDLNYSNTASIGGYSSDHNDSAKLSVDHEGYASTYRVRIFKFSDDNMDDPLPGAVFQLFENGPDGKIREMTYQVDHSSPIEDDVMWGIVNKDRAEGHTFPTPENHKKGDKIYFVTGNGNEGSAQAGFAEVMLSQSRDGVSLKKNKQYYLREVLEPDGHIKEDIDWRFIIGDNDDWDHYVYSDDSILQVSNASADPVLTVHKTFIDRSHSVTIDYDHEKNVKFEIEGKDFTTDTTVFSKTVTYGEFMRILKLNLDGTVARDEYVLTIHDLPSGNYTVRELRSSAEITDESAKTVLTTYVEGSASAHEEDEEGNPWVGSERQVDTTVENSGRTTDDAVFHFKVLDNEVSGWLTKTTADAEFTNIYTDDEPVSITVGKSWMNGGEDDFIPRRSEFTLYADGVKYPISSAEGGNQDGNLVITVPSGTTSPWYLSRTIASLPKRNSNGNDIVWTIEEVGATYHVEGHPNDTTVSGFLREHFKVEADTEWINGNTYQRKLKKEDEGNYSVAFSNTLNSLITVGVKKEWSDGNDNHLTDSVFFDLYRTTTEIPENCDYHALTSSSQLVVENIELNASNGWTYENDMLEKFSDQNNALYHYFVVEHSVAGYQDSYTRNHEGGHHQDVTIANTPIPSDPRGVLNITKNITKNVLGANLPNDFTKNYKFTLRNSGKYLHENGDLKNDRYEFAVQSGQSITLDNVKTGTYVLTEVSDAAQIGGYTLTSATVAVGNGAAVDVIGSGLSTEIVVPESCATGTGESQTATSTDVVVTNTYTKDPNPPTTDFTFGKLWVMPNAEDTTTLPWPKNVSTTMRVQRRIKGTTTVDESWQYDYKLAKGNADNTISVTPLQYNGTHMLTDNNPDIGDGANSVSNYHHYTFKLDQLEKFDGYGREWEYFATEIEVKDAAGNDLLKPDNPSGRSFVREYGHVDGIGAYSYTVADNKHDAAATDGGTVECAINRLEITKTVDVPVQKFINGTANWGATAGSSSTYPEFSFTLYDEFGHAVLDASAAEGGKPITATTNANGQAHFDLPESLINPDEMIWWPDKGILHGSQTFWIKEDDIENPAAAGWLDSLYQYYGIEEFSGSAKVTLAVEYNWLEGTLQSTAKVTNADHSHTDGEGRERAVINNTYQTGETELTVTKHWDDENNQDGYRCPVKFKVNASYRKKSGENNFEDVSLNKVWFIKDGPNNTKIQEEIILNDEDKTKEYRITIDPNDGDTTTVTLPKFYEGHLIRYSVEEKRDESVISEGVTLDAKYSETRAIAKIGNTYYSTLREAIQVAQSGDTVVLIADDTESFTTQGITIDKALTIDGKGHTVKGATSNGFTIQSGDVTISNLIMTQFGNAPISSPDSYGGKLTLTNVDIDTFTGTAVTINGGTFEITGGTINGGATNTGIVMGNTAGGSINGTTVRGKDGVVVGTGTVSFNNVDVVVSDTGIKANGGTVKILGRNTYVKAGDTKALVKGNDGAFSVEAGIYSNVVESAYCAWGYKPSAQLDNGMWTVVYENTAIPTVADGLVYNGGEQTGVASGDGYTVTEGGVGTDAREYTAKLTLTDDYRWADGTSDQKTIKWSIDKAIIELPEAENGLVYNGSAQIGVSDGDGYSVEGGSEINAGSYIATVTPDANYRFLDDTASKTVEWHIAKAAAIVHANDASKKANDSVDPTLTVSVTGIFGSDQLTYSVAREEGEDVGSYVITASGNAEQGNYTVSYENGTFVVLPADLSDDAVAYTIATDGGVTPYNTLMDAIANASEDNGYTVHLLKDIDLSVSLTVNNKVIIDGSKNDGTFSIRSINGINPLIQVSGTGDLTLGDVTVNANAQGRAIRVNSGKLTLNDGAKVTGGTTASSYIGGVYMTGTSVFTMNGGEITGNSVSSGYLTDGYLQYSADLWIGSEAKGTMRGGTVGNLFVNSNEYSKPSAGFIQSGGSITNAYLECDKYKASLTYNGGVLEHLYIAREDANTNNGQHNSPLEVSNPVAGTTYIAYSGVVRVEDTNGIRDYDSFESAEAEALSGAVVTLLADVSVSSTITINKDLTVNLNGYTLSGGNGTSSVFQVSGGATLVMDGSASGSTFIGQLHMGVGADDNGNTILNGGTYRSTEDFPVLHVDGSCTNSNVTIENATVESTDNTGILLIGAGTHTITNSTISGKTAVHLQSGRLTVGDSTLASTAITHADYANNDSGSNPTGDVVVVGSSALSSKNPTLVLGMGNKLNVLAGSGNVHVGYYEANVEDPNYEPGIVTATTNDSSLPQGYTWAGLSDGTYIVSKAWTVAFDPTGADAVDSQQVADGRRAVRPADPVRTDKKFLGWYESSSATPFDFDNTQIDANIILTARWEDAQKMPVSESYYTNRHDPEKIYVSVEKLWDDNNEMTKRSPVTMRLSATYLDEHDAAQTVTHESISEGSPWYPYIGAFADIELNDSVNWKNSTQWANLPRYAPGQQGKLVTYTVEEVASTIPLGYRQISKDEDPQVKSDTSAEPNGTAENVIKNKYESLNIPIKKIWDDDSNRDGLRTGITSVTMTLSAKTETETISVPADDFKDSSGQKIDGQKTISGISSENEWNNNGWAGLPKYYHGKEIAYTVTEDNVTAQLSGYTSSGTPAGTATPVANDSTGLRVVTNKHEIERKTVKFTKTWLDNQNQDDKRPDLLTYINNFVHIYATTDTNIPHQKELILGKPVSSDTGLDLNDPQSLERESYSYELNVKNEESGTPFKVNNEQVVVTLKGKHVNGHATNTYEIECTQLPAKENGKELTYTIEETDGDGNVLKQGTDYESLKPKDNDNSNNDFSHYKIKGEMLPDSEHPGIFTVTNEYEPETIKLTVKKANWVPKSGTQLSAEEISNLNSAVRVRLVAFEGDTRLEKEQIAKWGDKTNPHIDHSYNIEQEPMLNSEGEYTWAKLPVHNPESVGREVKYTIEEIGCEPGYRLTTVPVISAKDYAGGSATIELNNTYEDTTIEATKVWDDGHNQDGERKRVKFQLQKLVGEESSSNPYRDVSTINGQDGVKEVGGTGTNENATVATWTNLPAWENNVRVKYKVVEIPYSEEEKLVDGYTKVEGPFNNVENNQSSTFTSTFKAVDTITNGYTPKTKTVTFTKKWDHKGVVGVLDSLGEANYLSKLRLYAREADTINEVTDSSSTLSPGLFVAENSRNNNWRAHATVQKTDNNTYTIKVNDLPENKPSGTDQVTKIPLTYFLDEDTSGSDSTTNQLNLYNVQYPARDQSSGLPSDKITEGETLTNVRKTGSIRIEKQVESDLAADKTSEKFTFTISTNPKVVSDANVEATAFGCTYTNATSLDSDQPTKLYFDANGNAIVKLRHDQSLEISGLPVGVSYTITEAPVTNFTTEEKGNGQSEYMSASTFTHTLAEGSGINVSFRNTRILGNLSITKSIVSAVQSDLTKQFEFEIEFTNLADSAKGKMFGGITLNDAFKARFELTNGGSKSITGVPVGATYTIKEIAGDDSSAIESEVLNKFTTTWAKTVGTNTPMNSPTGADSKEFPGISGTDNAITKLPSSVAFTNTRKTGKLKLTKNVQSPFTADNNASYPFTVTLEMPSEQLVTTDITVTGDSNAQVSSSNGVVAVNAHASKSNPVTINGIPIDTLYTVVENSFSTPASSSDFDITYTDKGIGSSTETAQPAHSAHSMATTNTYEVEVENKRKVVPVSIRKVSASDRNAGLSGAEFTLQLTGATEGNDWHNAQLESTAASNGYLVRKNATGQDAGNELAGNELYLPLGEYTLTETKAPVGYNKLSRPITFTVTTDGVQNYTDSVYGKSATIMPEDQVVPLLVGNSTGVELPSTGSFGIVPYYMAGILLLGCFLVLCFV